MNDENMLLLETRMDVIENNVEILKRIIENMNKKDINELYNALKENGTNDIHSKKKTTKVKQNDE